MCSRKEKARVETVSSLMTWTFKSCTVPSTVFLLLAVSYQDQPIFKGRGCHILHLDAKRVKNSTFILKLPAYVGVYVGTRTKVFLKTDFSCTKFAIIAPAGEMNGMCQDYPNFFHIYL